MKVDIDYDKGVIRRHNHAASLSEVKEFCLKYHPDIIKSRSMTSTTGVKKIIWDSVFYDLRMQIEILLVTGYFKPLQ